MRRKRILFKNCILKWIDFIKTLALSETYKKMKNKNLFKGSLTTIILKLLAENGKMYGYEITQKVKKLTEGQLQITEGALYPALHKLEADGLLDSEMDLVDNRVRKYYKLSEIGQKETVVKMKEMDEFVQIMQSLINPKWRFLKW